MSDLNSQMEETQAAAEVVKNDSQDDKKIEIPLNPETAFTIKCQEFDKLIAEAEKQVADLKSKKATFIYDTNTQAVLKQYQEQQILAKAKQATA